jgi:hypothetical protein
LGFQVISPRRNRFPTLAKLGSATIAGCHRRWSRIMALMAISSFRATAASAAFFDFLRPAKRS